MPENYHTRELRTVDDVPLRELLDYAYELFDTYNKEPPRGFFSRFVRPVSSRTFVQRIPREMRFRETAEMEPARMGLELGDIKQKTFAVKTYTRSLGFSREFLEDNPSEMVREDLQELVRGAELTRWDIMFNLWKTGIADGSQLWFTPQDYGAYTFTDTHDHTFDTTQALFEADGDTDTGAHSMKEHIYEANKNLRHHGLQPDVAVMSHDHAQMFREEYTDDMTYHIPEAEGLRGVALPELNLRVDGVNIVQTSWLDKDDHIYLWSSSARPIAEHTVRPLELTDNTGAPVAGAGGSRGDPSALFGAYGSMRFGMMVHDPLAGVKFKPTNVA